MEAISPRLILVMNEVARQLDCARTEQETVHTIVETAKSAIQGVDEVSLTVSMKGRPRTVACTSERARHADDAQYAAEQGPCLEALMAPGAWISNDVEHDTRWPAAGGLVAAVGFRSQMSLHLFSKATVLGSLNLYATAPDALDEEARAVAELFASRAAAALGHVRRMETLSRAVHSREVIGQAIGLVMERYGLDQERAFDFLTRVSQNSNVKLRDVAADLVGEANRTARASGAKTRVP